jgi:RNA polymerase sigma-70 factor (ECF subfamily)
MRAEAAAVCRTMLRETADSLLAYFERRVASPEDAADLVAETMLQTWRRSEALPEDTERQHMWLFTIAANVLSNHRRSTRRRGALTERLRRNLTPSSAPDVAEATAVRDAVRRLPKPQCDLVMLIHRDGFSITQAAELLDVNPSTARSRYAAARETLRASLSTVCTT